MTPPDIRVAFLPSHREPASLGLPTLAGVMLAGGSKGKTEMMNGYTDSTVRCRTPDEARALAASLRSTLLERCGVTEVRVCEDGEDAHRPSCDSGIWSIDCHDRYLTLESPSFRGGTAPVFDVLGGNYWARDVEPPIAFLHRYEKDTTEEVAPRLATAFRQGTREVWVVDHGRSAHVAVFRTPDKGQVYMPGDVIPGSETFPRDVPVSAFVRKKRDDELLELLRSR